MQNDKIVILFFCSITVSLKEDKSRISKIVYTTQGPVRGYKEPEGIFGFHNIPYATAPTGPNKFKAPLPPPTWTEPFEAIDSITVCPQTYRMNHYYYNSTMIQKEDCLIANVFVPDTEKNKLPVLVYVHGGRFSSHLGNLVIPKTVVRNYNVIVVTFNYRLGVHGFLCLGTKDVPGNAGLKDQLAVLRWVKGNIAAFGGNPNDVTLAGYSSGGSCVDLIALSPAATGLFNKVIVDSSVGLIVPAIVSDPVENAKSFAVHMGFNDTDDVYALEHFYKTTPLKKLLRNDSYFNIRYDSTFYFAPCVERDTEHQEIKILTEPPLHTLKKGSYRQVPMLYGFTEMEGLFNVQYFDHWIEKMNDNFLEFLPGNLIFEDERDKEKISNETKKRYFGDESINEQSILKYVDYFSDTVFKHPLFRMIKMHLNAGHDSIYLYEYTYVDVDMPIIPHTNVRGAGHVLQKYAVFDSKYNDLTVVPKEYNITDRYGELKKTIRDFWVNFVKTGSPVPAGSDLAAWPPVGDVSLTPHMEITLPPRLRWQWDEHLLRRMRFWDSVYELHYRVPVPPRVPNSPLEFLDRSIIDTSQNEIFFNVIFNLFTVIYYALLTFIALINFVNYIVL